MSTSAPSETKQRTEIESRIRALGPWFQNICIGGVETAPGHFLGNYPQIKWQRFAHVLPEDLAGASVLDIGCNAGFYALEMKRRNAGRVVAIDSDPHYLRQAEFVFRHAGAEIELKQLSVYQLADLHEWFDLVLFMGVFYHLRYPLLALDLIHEHVAADRLLFQSLQRGGARAGEVADDYPFSEQNVFDAPKYPKLHFVENRYAGDPTNWFIPNAAAAEAMLRSAGFRIEQQPEREVYLCRRVERPQPVDPPPL
jgi:tRNA (mo5U34)-methyltransferase